ncbi:MAG: PIN domain-containing protein [Microcystis novacekii Mn_MB_F_20050700_S1]|uniref:PIN domain-containing protein n=1 Tax=Microcystis novacekii Mn_MB_F_20050700_S1D TaxID=2486266 RepID=A0A552JCF0_9CHRO|nr:MAG: PIN domain-containing protein [Microcystis novacekii Mn_MB_F_20050700_S1]TRU93433.1 MAG: PIN domain-containing protein [Microcystis novacekii Mn_MB_F_20050700_S1D]
MRVVFADTGYWVALLNPGDNLHKKAVQLSKTLHPVYIVTSEAVLIEVLNDFSKRGEYFRDLAIELTQNLRSNPNVRIVPQTSEQFEQGLRLYQQRQDKAWSHTDCVSFKIMEENGITEALAYDKHFAQAGFTALMRNCRV